MSNIILQRINSQNEVKVIQLICEVTGWDLAEGQAAADQVDSGNPFTIQNIPKEQMSDIATGGITMSANVETMFYVRERPWHGLGTEVQEAPTSADALIYAGLDWEVVQKDVYTEDGILQAVTGHISPF